MVEFVINVPTWISLAILVAGFIYPVPVTGITGVVCGVGSSKVSIWKGLGFGLLIGLVGIALNFLLIILGVGVLGIAPLAVLVASAAATWWVCVGRHRSRSEDRLVGHQGQKPPAGP